MKHWEIPHLATTKETMNPFQLLPEKFRIALYCAYGAAGAVVTSVAAGYGAIGHTVPMWDLWLAGALVPLTPLFGVTAVSNVAVAVKKPAAAPAPVAEKAAE